MFGDLFDGVGCESLFCVVSIDSENLKFDISIVRKRDRFLRSQTVRATENSCLFVVSDLIVRSLLDAVTEWGDDEFVLKCRVLGQIHLLHLETTRRVCSYVTCSETHRFVPIQMHLQVLAYRFLYQFENTRNPQPASDYLN